MHIYIYRYIIYIYIYVYIYMYVYIYIWYIYIYNYIYIIITNHTAYKPLWRNHDHHSFRPTIRPGLPTTRIYIPRSWAACVRASVPWWNSPIAMLDKWRVNGGFHKWGYPQMDSLFHGKCMKMPLKWMIWGYPYFRKPPNDTSFTFTGVKGSACSHLK